MTDLELCQMSGEVYDCEPTGETGNLEYLIRDNVTAVRGTEVKEVSDFARDAFAFAREHPVLGRGHAGFLLGADRLYWSMKKKLPGAGELIFTGHSLGSIEALFLAMLFHSDGRKVRWVGFGTPRGLIGARKLGFPARAYINGSDAVTKIPLPLMGGLGYRHPDFEVVRLGKTRGYPSIKDHSITTGYYANLARKLLRN